VKLVVEGTSDELLAFVVAAASAGVGIRRMPDGTPVATDRSDVVMRLKVKMTDPVPTDGSTRGPDGTATFISEKWSTPGDGGVAFADDLDRLFKDFRRRTGRNIGEGP
jgi:hypothetical protein